MFWKYATVRWPDHALAGEESQAELFGLITSLFDTSTIGWAVWSFSMEHDTLGLEIAKSDNSAVINDKDRSRAGLGRSSTTPLFWAAKFGLLQAVRYLLRVKKVDVNEHAILGRPALPIACAVGNLEILRELLQAGADTEVVFIADWQPIDSLPDSIASPDTFSPKFFTQEASVNALKEFKGLNIASSRSGYRFLVDASRKHMAWGRTPLETAINCDHVEAAKLLLQHGASPQFTGLPVDFPALEQAARCGNVSMVKLLLEHRTDASTLELRKGSNALLWAIGGHVDTDSNARGDACQAPPSLFFAKPNYQMVQILLESGADPNFFGKSCNHFGSPLRIAISIQSVPLVKLLLLHGADPNAVDQYDRTILPFAVAIEKSDNLMMKDSQGWTSLHGAVLTGQPEMVNLLLGHGADPDVGDLYGRTSLHLSIIVQVSDTNEGEGSFGNEETCTFVAPTDSERAEIVDRLLDNGANMDAQDNNGLTPLQYASMNSNDLPCKRLFERNALRTASQKHDGTPTLHPQQENERDQDHKEEKSGEETGGCSEQDDQRSVKSLRGR